MSSIATIQAPRFDWKCYPMTERLLDRLAARGRAGNAFAEGLSRRMTEETGTRFVDWIDHVALRDEPGLEGRLAELGYARDIQAESPQGRAFRHRGGVFPPLVLRPGQGEEVQELAIRVESIADFSRAHDLGLVPAGYALGPYRSARIDGQPTPLLIVERRGYRGFDPFSGASARAGRMAPHAARDALQARELWHGRKRRFEEDEQGFDEADRVLERVIDLCGGSTDLACHLVFEAERDFWESRNRAARAQKARQDRLGLGWANHDHHTFRCSRRFFPRAIRIFERLGFTLRERFHAGHDAGWGAQILEHPATGIVVFADLDLAPEEAEEDFAHAALPDLPAPNTVGLWVGLHGESMLDAGMHHLEAQFDFEALRDQLKAEEGIETMKPFSDFPFLRQAFTAGERWAVPRPRADRLLRLGWIDEAQHERFLREGALGSHLENLERREGYKGFNQKSVSAILQATDPRLHHAQP